MWGKGQDRAKSCFPRKAVPQFGASSIVATHRTVASGITRRFPSNPGPGGPQRQDDP